VSRRTIADDRYVRCKSPDIFEHDLRANGRSAFVARETGFYFPDHALAKPRPRAPLVPLGLDLAVAWRGIVCSAASKRRALSTLRTARLNASALACDGE